MLRSDEVRKDIAGLGHTAPAPAAPGEGLYRPELTDATYTALLERARTALELGESVILDASWSDRRHRTAAVEAARATVSDLVALECVAPAGVAEAHPGATNAAAIGSVDALLAGLDRGLVFANLVETDQVYGHRKDAEGFHRALREIDAAAGRWLAALRPGDLLVLTADHGCDITRPGSDHTREHAPLLARFDGHGGRRHDGPLADVGASVLAGSPARTRPGCPASRS